MSPRDPPLRLDDRFTHLVETGEDLLLVGDEDAFLLNLPFAADVIRLLDGTHTAVGIAQDLENRHRPEFVHFLLLKLEREGLVVRDDHQVPDPFGGHPPPGDRTSSVSVPLALQRAWEARGSPGAVALGLDDPGWDTSIDLLLTDDYLLPELLEFQETFRASGGSFLMMCLGSRRVWVGPRVLPGRTPCVGCLQERLRINLTSRALLHLPSEVAETEAVRVERLRRRVPWEAFLALAKALGEMRSSASEDGLLRVFPLEVPGGTGEVKARMEVETHAVHRLPHCSLCGDPTLAPPGAVLKLRPTPVVPGSSGGFRSVRPQDTIRRLEPLLSPLTGVIRHIRKIPVKGAELAHVYTANYARCYHSGSIRTVRSDRRDHAGGKGMTDDEARASALCESVERFSSVYRGTEPLQVARWSEMGPDAIPPRDLLLFSDEQYRTREAWNREDKSGFQYVPEQYLDEPIEWSPARCLVTGHTRFVPSAAVYFAFRGEGGRFCKGDSNGLASGNCLEEAILQGFLELVERDAVALWWYNHAPRPGVNLASFGNDQVHSTQELYATLGRSIWVLDLTNDLEIPTFAALSALLDGPREDIIFGFGAHLDPEVALLRALSELNQMLPTILPSLEDRRRQLLPEFENAIVWWEKARLEDHPYLLPSANQAVHSSGAFPSPNCRDLLEAVQYCVGRARSRGLDLIVHDLTRSDIGFPVARILVPGLRHFWRRLGPGRLYEVPVELGWIQEPQPEESMNPVSIFV